MLLKVTLKAGFYRDKDQQICQLLMYTCYWNQLMPEFIMKNCYQNQRHYFFVHALLNGEEYANNKDYNNALAYYNESGILFKTKL
jgi:hypothetical protein